MEITMNIESMKRFVKSNVMNQITNDNSARILVQGQPGMGKSEVIKQLCIENGWTLSVMYLSNMSIEQLTGIPQIDHNNGSVAKWSKPQILSFDNAEVTGNSGINVLLLDDIHLATKQMQAYLFQLLSLKALNGYSLPKNTAIILQGNRTCDKALANILPAPVANRMYFIQVKPDYKEWVDNFAIPNNLRPEIISYIIERGSTELFESPLENTAWASPRSWTNLSKELDSFEKVNGKINDDEYDFIIRGSIGENKANQFLMFTLLFAKWDFNKLKNMGIEKAFAEIKEQCNNNPTEQYAVLSAGMNYVTKMFAENDYKVNKEVKEASKFLFQVVNEFLICGNKIANTVKPLLVNIFNYFYSYCNAIKKNVTNVNVNALMQAFAENLKLANSKEYEKYKYSACVFYGTFCNITKITLTKEELKEIREAEEYIMNNK